MSAWIYIAGLIALLLAGICIFMRGASVGNAGSEDVRKDADECIARLTLDEYYAAIEEGGATDEFRRIRK